MKKKLIMSALFLASLKLCGVSEFFYPIAVVPDSSRDKVLCIHQDSARKLHVVLYNTSTQMCDSALSAQYNPIGVQPLSDGTGFSFIDNGIIKIKHFNKRSPKIIEICEPLYAIANIQWIDTQNCVFQAKRMNTFGIYTTNLDGDIKVLVADENYHALYPQRIDELLFYIKKTEDTYTVIEKNMLTEVQTELYHSQLPLAYLTMIDSERGYFLSYTIDEKCNIKYTVHVLSKVHTFGTEGWMQEELKDYAIERDKFFDNNDKSCLLCENLRPFLPHYSQMLLYINFVVTNSSWLLLHYDISHPACEDLLYSSFSEAPPIFMNGNNDKEIYFFGAPLLIEDTFIVGMAW